MKLHPDDTGRWVRFLRVPQETIHNAIQYATTDDRYCYMDSLSTIPTQSLVRHAPRRIDCFASEWKY